MREEINDLLDNAIYKEIASEAMYIAGQNKTQDPGAVLLMKELAEHEHQHAEALKHFKEKGLKDDSWYQKKVSDLKISQYLVAGDSLEGANIQDTLIFAMKREQQSAEFYMNMMGLLRDTTAKHMAHSMAVEELRHKLKLQTHYDDIFYREE